MKFISEIHVSLKSGHLDPEGLTIKKSLLSLNYDIEEVKTSKIYKIKMALTLDKIEVVTDYKHLQIREITDSGGYFRRVLNCGDDVSSEVQEIQDKAEAEWTDEVKSAWTTFQAEQENQTPHFPQAAE